MTTMTLIYVSMYFSILLISVIPCVDTTVFDCKTVNDSIALCAITTQAVHSCPLFCGLCDQRGQLEGKIPVHISRLVELRT
jgi:hypothetical protein